MLYGLIWRYYDALTISRHLQISKKSFSGGLTASARHAIMYTSTGKTHTTDGYKQGKHDRPTDARKRTANSGSKSTEPLQVHRRSTHGRTSQRWRPAADIVVYPDLVRDESRAGSTGQTAEKDNFRLRQVAVGKSPIGTGAGAGIASRFSLETVCTRHPIMHSNPCTLTTVTQPIAPNLPCRPRMEAAADRIMYGPTEARQPMGRSGHILAKRLGIDAMRLNCSLRANCA